MIKIFFFAKIHKLIFKVCNTFFVLITFCCCGYQNFPCFLASSLRNHKSTLYNDHNNKIIVLPHLAVPSALFKFSQTKGYLRLPILMNNFRLSQSFIKKKAYYNMTIALAKYKIRLWNRKFKPASKQSNLFKLVVYEPNSWLVVLNMVKHNHDFILIFIGSNFHNYSSQSY